MNPVTPQYATETLPGYADSYPATSYFDIVWAIYFLEYDAGTTSFQGGLESLWFELVSSNPGV